ncbi:hypothetical protein [Devosia sp. LjRoot3]|uniref:hypothetical protein n=1 Tax=Devosia sp. LjRoot3 TaxID=3342319 RepID=UPI003ED01AFA
MKSELELAAYIREVNVVAKTWVSEATSYAKYRAIGIGFTKNASWLRDTSPPSISFFNGLTAMLDLALVMSIWKMTERLKGKDDKHRPGEIFIGHVNEKRRTHDEIRSLPRAAFLFRDAFAISPDSYRFRYSERQREIVEQYNLPRRDMDQYAEKILEDWQFLLGLCDRIDKLVMSKECQNLDIVRNQGFAHSSEISRTSISLGINPEGVDFTRTNLFQFGDAVMQTALDFEAVWSQRARPSIKDLVNQGVEVGSDFWRDAKRGLES